MAPHLPVIGGHAEGFRATQRTDCWWRGPAITVFVFTTFIVYTTWALWQGNHYDAHHQGAPYLSPMYEPVLFAKPGVPGGVDPSAAWFGAWPSWWPSFLPASPAMLILIFPLSFRMTCYYYRKAYYRAYAGSPPGCAVGPLAGGRTYHGETRLLVIQNLHRFALYAALVVFVLLVKGALASFVLDGKLGIGLGSVIMTLNVALLGAYLFGCHSLRHLVGGRKDCMSCGRRTARYNAWKAVSWFNGRHALFAWLSLIWVVVTDLYIRLVSMGVIADWNTW